MFLCFPFVVSHWSHWRTVLSSVLLMSFVQGYFLLQSSLFVYIFFGIAIKLSSPYPVFFKQKRSGEDGREFWCYKFRSMKVNTQCDTLHTTENDPRKNTYRRDYEED